MCIGNWVVVDNWEISIGGWLHLNEFSSLLWFVAHSIILDLLVILLLLVIAKNWSGVDSNISYLLLLNMVDGYDMLGGSTDQTRSQSDDKDQLLTAEIQESNLKGME